MSYYLVSTHQHFAIFISILCPLPFWGLNILKQIPDQHITFTHKYFIDMHFVHVNMYVGSYIITLDKININSLILSNVQFMLFPNCFKNVFLKLVWLKLGCKQGPPHITFGWYVFKISVNS